MRDHATIVREFGAQALARLLNDNGLEVHASTPQRWADRNSIPGEYWAMLVEKNVATLEELAAAADRRKPAEDDASPKAPSSGPSEGRSDPETAPTPDREAA